jgi:hypothetical protein
MKVKTTTWMNHVLNSLNVTNVELPCHEIPSQYKELKDVFEKKNIDTLLKHHPYDYTIDLGEGAQLPFGLIYNLSQDELCSSL